MMRWLLSEIRGDALEPPSRGNPMDDAALLRYSRQLLLPAIDMDGQERLLASTVLILGLGGPWGTGCALSGRSRRGHPTPSGRRPHRPFNLPRQVLYSEADLGEKKSIAAKARLAAQNHTLTLEALSCPHGDGAHGSRKSGGPCARLHGPLRHSRRAQRGVPGHRDALDQRSCPPDRRAADGV